MFLSRDSPLQSEAASLIVFPGHAACPRGSGYPQEEFDAVSSRADVSALERVWRQQSLARQLAHHQPSKRPTGDDSDWPLGKPSNDWRPKTHASQLIGSR